MPQFLNKSFAADIITELQGRYEWYRSNEHPIGLIRLLRHQFSKLPSNTTKIDELCAHIANTYIECYPNYKSEGVDYEDTVSSVTTLLAHVKVLHDALHTFRAQEKYTEIRFIEQVQNAMQIELFSGFELRKVYYYITNLPLNKEEVGPVNIIYSERPSKVALYRR